MKVTCRQPESILAERDRIDASRKPAQPLEFLSRGRIPDPRRQVPTPGSQAAAIGAEGQTVNFLVVPADRKEFLACITLQRSRIPDPHRPIGACRHKTVAVRAEGNI